MTEPAADRVRRALEAESAAWARKHLDEDVVGWFTSVAPDGRVQTSPISFLWDGETVLFYSKPDAPKVRNIAANPQVAFCLNTDEYGDRIVEPLEHWELDEAETSRDFSAAIVIRPTRIRV